MSGNICKRVRHVCTGNMRVIYSTKTSSGYKKKGVSQVATCIFIVVNNSTMLHRSPAFMPLNSSTLGAERTVTFLSGAIVDDLIKPGEIFRCCISWFSISMLTETDTMYGPYRRAFNTAKHANKDEADTKINMTESRSAFQGWIQNDVRI